MEARFAPALLSLGGHITLALVAAATGTGWVFAQKRGAHRAILRHAVLVRDGRCVNRVRVLVLFASTHVR